MMRALLQAQHLSLPYHFFGKGVEGRSRIQDPSPGCPLGDPPKGLISFEREGIDFIQDQQIEGLVVAVELVPLLYYLYAILPLHYSIQGSMPFCDDDPL